MSERRAMIQADHLLAVTRRCELLDVARSTVYYRPTGISAGGPGPDAPLGRDPLSASVLRQSPPSRRDRDPGNPGESQASPAPGAPDGPARPVSEAAHEPARGRTHGVSVPAEGPVHRATESGVGNRYLLHPDGARVHVSGGHHGLVLAPRPGLAGVEHLRTATSVSRPSRTRSPATGRRRSSIRTKAPSSRPRRLRRCSRPTRWPSAWTARAAGSTTCSSSGSGAASNTRMCISMRTKHPPRSAQG